MECAVNTGPMLVIRLIESCEQLLGYFGGTGFPEGDGRTKIRVEHPTDYDETQDNE